MDRLPEYQATGGQCCRPFGKKITPYAKWTNLQRPDPPLPEIHLLPEWEEKGWRMWRDSCHIIPGVTAEMIDWYWANMEKGYYLWAPGSHKSFQWIREPWRVGFVGSEHAYTENFKEGDPLEPGRFFNPTRYDMDRFMFDYAMEHVIIEGKKDADGRIDGYNLHMYEDIEGGVLHRYVSCKDITAPGYQSNPHPLYESIRNVSEHVEYEASRWPHFLPQLYSIWKDHPDPCQNVQCNLTVEKVGENKYRYVHENGPVKIDE